MAIQGWLLLALARRGRPPLGMIARHRWRWSALP
jgi:hypothetical protein